MALNLHFLVPSMTIIMQVLTIVFVAVRRCLTRKQSLILVLAGPVFIRQWTKHPLKKPKITAFSCDEPKLAAVLVMHILVMFFQTDRNRPAFAIASTQRHSIFKKMSEKRNAPR
jgi:MFS superfamily sulfate permease-like transporter